MRRCIPVLVLVGMFFGLGTGFFNYIHTLHHVRTDAEHLAAAERAGMPNPPTPVHDDSDCFVHRNLHLPAISVGWAPLLLSIGLVVGFITEIMAPLVRQRLLLRISCRGPPA